MENIKIGPKIIGKNKPCFIIAEAGVNHNGKIELAKKLVDAAISAKADAVKFQSFKTEDLVTEKADIAEYAAKNIGKTVLQKELLKGLEFGEKEFVELKKYCDKKDILFLTTAHTPGKLLDVVNSLVPAFKIGSGDLTNHVFLEEIAAKGKPIILSTGMSTMNEVKEALETIYKTGNRQVILLHCTTSYPCPYKEVNLNAMKTMQAELDCLIGYSDHSHGIIVPIMAASLGAVVIEKHLTLDSKMPGADHKASLEPDELKEMVESIRIAEIALGSSEKKPMESEQAIAKKVRKSLVAKESIPKGSTITKDLVSIKRPGTGLKPALIGKVIGKKALKDIAKEELIQLSDVQ